VVVVVVVVCHTQWNVVSVELQLIKPGSRASSNRPARTYALYWRQDT
jgi:hypothetical protein